MRAPSRKATGVGATLLVAAALAASIPALAQSGSKPAAPDRSVAVIVPAANVTFDLCAKAGTVDLPGLAGLPIWGFALDEGSGCGVATLPGPELVVNEGDVVTVNLTNELGENVSLAFPGQSLIPDVTGAPPSGTVSYTFTAGRPGAYLYESGTNTAVQVGMGLYGALLVRPAFGAGYAYNDASTLFDVEDVLVLSEIDPALNLSADPLTFDFVGDPDVFTAGYHPTFFLIDGKAYPDTDPVEAAPGDAVLLRYLNAGFLNHTMTLLGDDQRVIARDAYPVPAQVDVVAETIPAGATLDTIVTAEAVGSFPLYNRQLNITNGDAANPQHFVPGGGMMTFLNVAP